ncbi:MAG TPA: nucleoside triphosphate pyrophosphohydrolase [Puia sp.]|nr:nucleoside triphosphate pyrophosphohydrolase [Puia sp.]
MSSPGISLTRLVNIMDDLREKCPWDRKQTIDSLRSMTIEETYELAECISSHDWEGIKEEAGDLLLHIVFYAKIAQEEGRFTIDDIVDGVCEKLIVRHPHVYGTTIVENEEDVKKNWEKIKIREGKKSVLGGVPASLPATVKAMRLQEKAKQVGFEWENAKEVWEKVKEEMQELQAAVQANDRPNMEDEFGDLVFSLINYARFLQIDAESALEKTNRKFTARFNKMEETALSEGKSLDELTLDRMNQIWDAIKKLKIQD